MNTSNVVNIELLINKATLQIHLGSNLLILSFHTNDPRTRSGIIYELYKIFKFKMNFDDVTNDELRFIRLEADYQNLSIENIQGLKKFKIEFLDPNTLKALLMMDNV